MHVASKYTECTCTVTEKVYQIYSLIPDAGDHTQPEYRDGLEMNNNVASQLTHTFRQN